MREWAPGIRGQIGHRLVQRRRRRTIAPALGTMTGGAELPIELLAILEGIAGA
jgi:hypothetical protein